jgi:hypothetical protein
MELDPGWRRGALVVGTTSGSGDLWFDRYACGRIGRLFGSNIVLFGYVRGESYMRKKYS